MEGAEVALLMCDLSAAFDTVPHDVLLDKLALYGATPETIRWFRSYLGNRQQYVDVNGGISGMKKINYGVFQGSCGGPLLFIVFFNDIMELQDDSTMILGYADDNNYKITLSEDVEANKRMVNEKLVEVEEYMNANRLKFNASKTQLMIMTPKRNRVNSTLELEFNGLRIIPEKQAKFLGILISDDLTWDNYVAHSEFSLLKFCAGRMKALKKLRKFCTKDQLKLLSHGLITSKIIYCLPVWANVRIALRKKIQGVMTEMYRVITNDWKSSVGALHRSLDAFLYDGWVKYMDVMTGKSISNFNKPEDLSDKIRGNFRDEDLEARYNTRARARGQIPYTAENTSNYNPRHTSFLPRMIREYNKMATELSSAHLITSSQTEIKKMKEDVKYLIRKNQIYY